MLPRCLYSPYCLAEVFSETCIQHRESLCVRTEAKGHSAPQ
jgi:hypothetical protein